MIFSQSRIPKHFALCRLLTTQEAWLLSKAGDPVLHWTALWTVPLAWAARLISHAFNTTVIVPKDHKELLAPGICFRASGNSS